MSPPASFTPARPFVMVVSRPTIFGLNTGSTKNLIHFWGHLPLLLPLFLDSLPPPPPCRLWTPWSSQDLHQFGTDPYLFEGVGQENAYCSRTGQAWPSIVWVSWFPLDQDCTMLTRFSNTVIGTFFSIPDIFPSFRLLPYLSGLRFEQAPHRGHDH